MKISRDYIIQYLKGELSYSEHHEFERKMLEDPLLSDAIEGLQQIENEEKLDEAINELDIFIESSYGKRRVFLPLYRNPLAIAAVIMLLIISVAILFFVPDYRQRIQSLFIPNDRSEIMQPEESEANKFKELEAETEPAETLLQQDSIFETIQQAGLEIDTIQGAGGVTDPEETAFVAEVIEQEALDKNLIDEKTAVEDEVVLADNQVSPDTTSGLLTDMDAGDIAVDIAQEPTELFEAEEAQIAEDRAPVAAKRALARESPATPAIQTKDISGVVRSASDNQPISGVNVLVSGTSRGTITDGSGVYNLQLSANDNVLQFSNIGFQPSEISIPEEGTYNVSLTEDLQQLSEIAVVGLAGNRSREPDRYTSPESGRINYNRYLRENVNYTTQAAENNVNGRVIVEFTVAADGSISTFEIVRSLGFGCEEEAIRLIREGPVWQPAVSEGNRIDERVRVAVRFRPPSD